MAVVTDSFLNGASFSIEAAQEREAGDWSFTDDDRINLPDNYTRVIEDMRLAALNSSAPYIRHNVTACFDYYDDYFAPQGNGLIFVKNASVQNSADDSVLLWVSVVPRDDDWAKNLWAVANGTFPVIGLLKSPSTPVTRWFLGKPHYEVDHCLLQKMPTSEKKCQLQYSPWILTIVCAFNLIKMSVIFSVWIANRRVRGARGRASGSTSLAAAAKDEPLDTIGDAIQSFMRNPDPTTENMCLATWRDFQSPFWGARRNHNGGITREWKAEKKRWRHATSLRQWTLFSVL